VKPKLAEMIKIIKEKVAERDAKVAAGEVAQDTRPGWRILRAEIWRQFGALLDLEKRYDKESTDELLAYCTTQVAASMIQQRERLYDLAHMQMAAVIEKVLDPEMVED